MPKLSAWVAPALFLLLAGCGGGAPPNVILLVIDTLRADHVHAYGYPRETTPALDRLAAEGVRFEAAISPSSWSAPSQTTIVTGAHPYRHEVMNFGQRIRSGVEPLAARLERQGYATGLFSTHLALHRGVEGITAGLNHQFVVKDGRDDDVLEEALGWAERAQRPFFLYVVVTAPHAPYVKYPRSYDGEFFTDTPPGGERRYPFTSVQWVGEGGIPASVRLGDFDRVGFYVNRYDRSVRYVDELVGRFREGLGLAGLLDETLWVLTSDHGEGLGDHDCFAHELYLYDFLVRVPLIIRYPRAVPPGVWSPQVGLADIVPTILGLAGLAPTGELDGVDLSPHLRAGSRPEAGRLVAGSYRHRGFDRYMLRSDRYKLLFDAVAEREELYDLRADPRELENLLPPDGEGFPGADYEELRAGLRALLAQHARVDAARASVPLSPEVVEELRALGYLE